jgi:hypothetical protein
MYLDHTYRPPRALRVLAIALIVVMGMLALSAARATRASANIDYPYEFMPYIDGYSPYQPHGNCPAHQQEMPGVRDFANYLKFWFDRDAAIGIVRPCSDPRPSEHWEGRALDFHVNARTDPATTLKILANVLGTDKYGNAHALGRRFGIMYIISNGRMFRFYRPGDGWQPYRPSSREAYCTPNTDPRVTACHIDHIHFSFGWAGALRQTSWWTTTIRTVRGCGSAVETWRFNSAFGPLVQIKKIKDAYGKTFDTQSEIRNSYWRTRVNGNEYLANQPLSLLGRPAPQAMLPTSLGPCLFNL